MLIRVSYLQNGTSIEKPDTDCASYEANKSRLMHADSHVSIRTCLLLIFNVLFLYLFPLLGHKDE